jgi:hypothetical protein
LHGLKENTNKASYATKELKTQSLSETTFKHSL